MTEYEKKLEELRGICEWLQEHGDEVDKQDGTVIIAFEDPGEPFKACISAGGHLMKLMALHMAILKCMEKNADEDEPDGFVETMNKLGELAGVGPDWWMLGPADDFDEDDRVETKAGSFGVYAKHEEDVEKLQAALEKLIEEERKGERANTI